MSEANVFGMDFETEEPVAAASTTDPAPKPAEDPPPAAPAAAEPAAEPEPTAAPDDAAQPQEEAPDDDETQFESKDGEGIRLGNKVYKDWQGADHVFRQFRGRAQAAETRAKEARERAEKAERLLEEALKSRAQEPAAAPAQPAQDPAPAPRTVADLLPTEDEIDSMIAEHGPAQAMRKVAELMLSKAVPEVVNEQTGDVQRLAKVQRGMSAAEQLFESMSSEGKYPELVPDDPASQEVVNIWYGEIASNPKLAHLALTPEGVELAIEKFRGRRQPVTATAPTPEPTPAPRLVAQVRQQAAAQRSLQDMSGSSTRPAPGPVVQRNLEEEARLAVAAKRHSVFGAELE